MLKSPIICWLGVIKSTKSIIGTSCNLSRSFSKYENQSEHVPVDFLDVMNSWRQKKMVEQVYEHFLVIDFEATCEENQKIQPVQEIIEFPVVQIEAKSFCEVARFHQYVKPTERPFLTSFCTSLTGILQEMVDKSKNLPAVLDDFHQWLLSRSLLNSDGTMSSPWIMVTCGDWDLGIQLPQEAKYRSLELPDYFGEWINLKKTYAEAKGYFPNSLSVMLRDLGIEPMGRLHSGIDDVRNMCAILRTLAFSGHVLLPTISSVTETSSVRLPRFRRSFQRAHFVWNKKSFKAKHL